MTHNGMLMNMKIDRWKFLRQIFLKGLTTKLIAQTARNIAKGTEELLANSYKPGPDGVIRIDDIYRFMFLVISKAILRLGFGIIADEGLQGLSSSGYAWLLTSLHLLYSYTKVALAYNVYENQASSRCCTCPLYLFRENSE